MPIAGVWTVPQFKDNSKAKTPRFFANFKSIETALRLAHTKTSAADQTTALMDLKDRCEDWLTTFRRSNPGNEHRGEFAKHSNRFAGVSKLLDQVVQALHGTFATLYAAEMNRRKAAFDEERAGGIVQLRKYSQSGDPRLEADKLLYDGWCFGMVSHWLGRDRQVTEQSYWEWFETDSAVSKIRFVMAGQSLGLGAVSGHAIPDIVVWRDARARAKATGRTPDRRDVTNDATRLANTEADRWRKRLLKSYGMSLRHETGPGFYHLNDVYLVQELSRYPEKHVLVSLNGAGAHATGLIKEAGSWRFMDPNGGEWGFPPGSHEFFRARMAKELGQFTGFRLSFYSP